MALADFKNSIITQDKFSTTFNKFDRGVQTSARGLDKLGGVLSSGGVGMLFGATAGVAGAAAIAKTAFALGDLGAQSLTTKASFESLMRSVGVSTSLLDQLKASAGGTMTELQLMQQTNTALAGSTGALSTEMAAALPKLLEAGRAAALLNPSMGDANFMFQSLVTGIKRGSPMLIDNTGITLKLGEATEAYAQSVGKSVTELTAQERSIAILRGTLAGADTLIKQTGGNLDGMATSAGKLKTAWMELKTAIGEGLAPITSGIQEGAAGVLSQMTSIIGSDEVDKQTASLRSWAEQLEYLNSIPVSERDEMWASDIAETTRQIQRLREEIGQRMQAEQAANMITQAAAWSARDAASAYGESAIASRTAGLNMAALAATLQGVRNAYDTASAAASRMAGIVGGNITSRAFLGGADVLSQGQYASLTQNRINLERSLQVQVELGTKTQIEADYALAQYDRTVNDHIASLRTQTKEVGSTATAYDDLKSKIGSALTPTFDLSGLTGGLLGQMGGDTFDEAYKRLAAVALRPEELQIHAGDWADTFEKAGLIGLTPEDAQAEARRLVEEYNKGLNFDLIDREKIKDSVRQAIRAEEIYNTIVDEIYAEMGKENTKLQTAGTKLGNQLNKATTAAVKSGAPAYVNAWLDVLEPAMIRRLDERYRRTGDRMQ